MIIRNWRNPFRSKTNFSLTPLLERFKQRNYRFWRIYEARCQDSCLLNFTLTRYISGIDLGMWIFFLLISTTKEGTISVRSTPREFEAWLTGIKWGMNFQLSNNTNIWVLIFLNQFNFYNEIENVQKFYRSFDVHGSLQRNKKLIERTNKM
jgi:hypothetical protein